MSNIESIYKLILNDGILEYKYKNSKYKYCSNVENIHKGSVFTFNKKEDLTRGKGLILTSLEALYDVSKHITHWTPNVYRYATYLNKERSIILGHSEDNLKQINTFYIDIDHVDINEYDILQASIELQFMPTLIVKTTRGYQVYFVLEKPVYVTSKSDFKVIQVAKTISKNLRNYFEKEGFNVDLLCNHFGIARFPTKDNVVFFRKENMYPFMDWIDWSMRQTDDNYFETNKKTFYIIRGNKGISQIDEKWFALLLNSKHVQGKKELLGRNNVLFTLALACYSSGLTQKEAKIKLQVFNENLENKLKDKEYLRIIESAYSGRYNTASSEYILTLARNWLREDIKRSELFSIQRWVKHKKERIDRQRTHFNEWETDVLRYISKIDKTFLEIKKKHLLDALNIPKRSLDRVLKTLQNKNLIFYKSTAGRSGGIKIALISKVYRSTITMIKDAKDRYYKQLSYFFEGNSNTMISNVKKYEENIYLSDDYVLFEEDVGKVVFI